MSKQADLMTQIITLQQDEANVKRALSDAWDEVFIMADEISGPDQPYRFLDPERGMVMGRQIAQMADALDEEAFINSLTDAERRACTRQVTTTRLMPDLLETACRKDPALAAKVQAAMVPGKVVPRRFGPRNANKEELEELGHGA